jgi:hypothetical protein
MWAFLFWLPAAVTPVKHLLRRTLQRLVIN